MKNLNLSFISREKPESTWIKWRTAAIWAGFLINSCTLALCCPKWQQQSTAEPERQDWGCLMFIPHRLLRKCLVRDSPEVDYGFFTCRKFEFVHRKTLISWMVVTRRNFCCTVRVWRKILIEKNISWCLNSNLFEQSIKK